MADISIQEAHRPVLRRAQTLLEYLHAETARLQVELAALSRQRAQIEGETAALLQRAYGIDAQHVAWGLDSERGVIVTPDTTPSSAAATEE